MPFEAVICKHLNKSFWTKHSEVNGSYKNIWHFRKKQKKQAVKDINMSVKQGEIFGILGPNGSGKSTLIRLISTLLLPDTGKIHVFGQDTVKQPLIVRRLINRVSVEAAFFKKLSPMENLHYAARLYGISIAEANRKSMDILLRLGIEKSQFTMSMEDFSRGMQQKVAVARALLTSPVLLLLDEPTTGLDPKSKRDVQDFIKEVRNEHKATVLLTTHDMNEAEKLCDRIAFIHQGRFVALDTVEGLKNRFGNNKTSSLEDIFLEVTGHDWPDEVIP